MRRRIDHPDEQAGEEDEALRVLNEAELGMVEAHEQVAAGEHQMGQEHEDEEIAAQTVDSAKPSHGLTSCKNRATAKELCPRKVPPRPAHHRLADDFRRLGQDQGRDAAVGG